MSPSSLPVGQSDDDAGAVAAMLAGDAADRRLLDAVRPADWPDPALPAGRYHLVVVGAGTAGLVSAAIAAGLGARVALVERRLMGGDCLNVGCVPSKALLRAARAWHDARRAAPDFAGPPPADHDGAAGFAAAMARLRALRARLAPVDSAARFRDLGVDVWLGGARFVARDAVAVRGGDGREARLPFWRAIVATGGRPTLPDLPGLADCGPLTNETVFALTARPRRLLVLGGGPIGCELAQAMARLGVAVTLVHAGDRLLPKDDPEASALVARALAADGVALHLGARATAAGRRGDERTLTITRADGASETLVGDALLVATGRAPNVEGIGLDAAGVAHDRRGIAVDDRLRTSNRRILAVGDCNALGQRFTHAADAQARLAVPNALFLGLGGGRASRLVVPWCTYTSPEVAHVGLTADEAARRAGPSGDVDTLTVPFGEVDRAVLDAPDGAPTGFLRAHLARGGDRLLGATICGEHAGELIGELAATIARGEGLGSVARGIRPYPTVAAALVKAADLRRRERLTPLARRAFAAWFGVVGRAVGR